MSEEDKQIYYFLLQLDYIDSVLDSNIRNSDKVSMIRNFMRSKFHPKKYYE